MAILMRSMRQLTIPPRDQIGPDTPLRLAVAAAVFFPDGSMTAAGLRRERDRGRLVVERTAGKDYTTLTEINRMRELCRINPRELSRPGAPAPGSPADVERANAAAKIEKARAVSAAEP